jgi:Uma2 family endonuclease
MAVEHLELESRPPLTVEEFEALAEAEGWDEDTRVELLDGEVVWMSPINDPHVGCVNRLTRLFAGRYAEDVALLSIQNPVRVGDYDLPQPDVALLRPRADFYGSGKATPADVLLLVEVSDSTLRTDLGRKARIYADAGVGEYWVIDLNNRVLYVHRARQTGRYATRRVLGPEEQISAVFAPAVEFRVNDLIG